MPGDNDSPELPQEPPSEKEKTTQDNGPPSTVEIHATTPTNAITKDSTAGPAHDATTTKESPPPKSESINDPEAQAMVIESLKSQILDLSTQVTQLNGKLIRSYDRISDLEDSLHSSTAKLDTSTSRIVSLEAERTQHLSALTTGMLVEKSHVTAELTRLMEKASEEAIHRGEAENRKKEIEKELDDLSASLFEQANVMVRDARVQREISERKASDAEEALKVAEEAVGVMQVSMQQLQHDKDAAESYLRDMKGKSRVVERPDPVTSIRLFSSHLPYYEFLSFIAHLRSLHTSTAQPPSISTLLPLPFLARLLTEDSEPTVRLDLAPSLNWLSRRSVLSAIHSGQLTVEPMATSALLNEPSVSKQISSPTSSPIPIVSSSSSHSIPCALCGSPIFGHAEGLHSPRPTIHPALAAVNGATQNGSSWSTTIFKRASNTSATRDPSPPPRPPRANGHVLHTSASIKQVYVFRLAAPTSSFQSIPIPISLPSALQNSSSPSPSFAASHSPSTSKTPTPSPTPIRHNSPQANTSAIYPLCSSNWCLARLRSTCTLWAFVRTGIVEKVWEEEIPAPNLTPGITGPNDVDDKLGGVTAVSRKNSSDDSTQSGKPPIPPRRRGLWGMASALGERAASWTRESSRDRAQGDASKGSGDDDKRSTHPLPPPPPTHPHITHSEAPSVPPPLPRRSEGRRPVPPPPSRVVSSDDAVSQPPAPTSATVQEASQPAAKVDSSENVPDFDKPPLSPRNIPLPESRPATPTGQAFLRGSKLNPNTPPSRSGSPAPGPTPPPLPRRAAARSARPLSTVGTDVPIPSRPSTPSGAVSSDPGEPRRSNDLAAPTDGQQEGSKADSPPVLPNEGNGIQVSSDLPEATGPSTAGDVTSDNVGAENAKPDTTTSADEDDKLSDPIKESSTVVDAPLDPQGDVKTEAAEVHANGNTTTPEDSDTSKLEPDTKAVPDSEDTLEKGTFVGDSTWEEKAWKEIVRLREDMFWARVGASR